MTNALTPKGIRLNIVFTIRILNKLTLECLQCQESQSAQSPMSDVCIYRKIVQNVRTPICDYEAAWIC